MARSKKYRNNITKIDKTHLYSPTDALTILNGLEFSSSGESVDVVFKLGVDPRKADQIVRGTVTLPEGTGKEVRILVFAEGEAATQARSAGADIVGSDELIAEIEGGMTDFDVAISTPEMMPKVSQLGRLLGPRGLLPNPKTGTVTSEVDKAVEEFKGGKIEYRTDRYGNVHSTLGRSSFDTSKLMNNFKAIVSELWRAKPAAAKGKYIRKVHLSPTWGPSIGIDPALIGND